MSLKTGFIMQSINALEFRSSWRHLQRLATDASPLLQMRRMQILPSLMQYLVDLISPEAQE